MMMSMMLGGIRIPSVPDAAITPQDRAGLYFCLSMVGSASAVIIVTDATDDSGHRGEDGPHDGHSEGKRPGDPV